MKAKDLKNSILQMAVQGKLVPQDPSDEPASVLLERIREERHELIKEGKIKATKGGESVIYRTSDGSHYEKRIDSKGRESEPVCIDDEIPFEIPDSWEWARLDSLAFYKKGPFGSSITKAMFVPESPQAKKVYEQQNAIKKDAQLGNYFITEEKYKELKSCEVLPGDIIVSCAGTIGETYVMPNDMRPGILNQALMRIALYDSRICDYYLVYFDHAIKNQSARAGKGTALNNIPPLSEFKQYLCPLPPLAEQSRIVAKIDKLMPLVEEYGKLEDEREQLDSELPDRLRKSILQQAVQGKLVPQEPSDEPASVLLERIREERHELIKEGKIKAPKGGDGVIYRGSDGGYYEKRIDARGHESEPVCINDEIPFEIPDSWEWCRLGSISKQIHYGYTHSATSKGNARFLRITDIKDGHVYWENVPYVNIEQKELMKYRLQINDIVIARSGSVGKAYIAKDLDETSVFASYLIRVVLILPRLSSYLEAYFDSPFYWEQIAEATQGTGQQNVNAKNLSNLLVPISPLAEQSRIVAKLDELMPLLTSQQ